jgi:hypothetical protein
MNKVAIVRNISRGYFFLALAVSFLHLIHAAHKGGLDWEAWLVPFMVDGIAVMGVVLRGEEFAKRTRKIGFRTQVVAGTLSLAGNVYAAHNAGGVVLGTAVVVLFVFAEWLTDQIESAEVEAAREAAELAAQAKAAAIAKGQATRKANARKAQSVVKGAETITKRAARTK